MTQFTDDGFTSRTNQLTTHFGILSGTTQMTQFTLSGFTSKTSQLTQFPQGGLIRRITKLTQWKNHSIDSIHSIPLTCGNIVVIKILLLIMSITSCCRYTWWMASSITQILASTTQMTQFTYAGFTRKTNQLTQFTQVGSLAEPIH